MNLGGLSWIDGAHGAVATAEPIVALPVRHHGRHVVVVAIAVQGCADIDGFVEMEVIPAAGVPADGHHFDVV